MTTGGRAVSDKRIRLITFHTPKNYGAVLQAFALMTCLQQYADDVKVIDFNTPHLRALYPLRRKPASVKAFAQYLLNFFFDGKKKRKYAKIDEFVVRHLDLTKRYESIAALQAEPPEAEHYFTGSDQVFNPNRIEEERKAFYLDFGGGDVKRVAYAASFGVKSVPEEKCAEIADRLSAFHRISVREESGVKIVEALSDKQAVAVLDPVFLMDKAFWTAAAQPRPVGDEPYLLYYRLMGGEKSDRAARLAAKKKGLKLVVVADGFMKWRADKTLRDVGPQELLSLYEHAAFVATDSFHGTAFSLIFEKQFLFTDHDPALAERALHLMERTGCSQCACLNGGTGDEQIDYAQVSERLGALIARSRQFIEEAIR